MVFRIYIRELNKWHALLVTVILHLLLGIAFYMVKITGIYTQDIKVEVETPESIRQDQEEAIRKREELKEQLQQYNNKVDAFIAAQQRSNIGVNLTDMQKTSDKDIWETQQEIEKAREQIRGIEEHLEKTKKIEIISSSDGENISEKKEFKKPEGKLVVYKGPTNIYYKLQNRRNSYLYVPVYKCYTYGQVVVDILVDKQGNVVDAKINRSQSDNDPCLLDAAYDAALRSKFNADVNAPAQQSGTITYLFVSQ